MILLQCATRARGAIKKGTTSEGALEYWSKVAEMGDVEEHFRLSILYDDGKGVWKD